MNNPTSLSGKKILVAVTGSIAAVKSPILKSITKGIRITKSGIVCMVSLKGLTTADTVSLVAAQIPMQLPKTKDITTAIPQTYKESIASDQTPVVTIKESPSTVPIPKFIPPIFQATNP